MFPIKASYNRIGKQKFVYNKMFPIKAAYTVTELASRNSFSIDEAK